MIRFFISSFFIFIILQVQGQYKWTPGEIHYNNGDIEKGKIELEPKRDGVQYKKPDVVKFNEGGSIYKREIASVDINKIVFYRLNNSQKTEYKFIKTIDDRLVLAYIVDSGKVELYKRIVFTRFNATPTSGGHMKAGSFMYVNHGTSGAIEYNYVPTAEPEMYVIKQGESGATQLNKKFKKTALEYFSECPTVIETLNSKEYKRTEIDIDAIVAEYNSCF